MQRIFFHNGQRLLCGRGIRIRRPGGDHVQRIADNVGQDDGKHPGRCTVLREPPRLHAGEALADRIHLHNVRPAGQKLARDALLLLRCDERQLKKRRTAAGHQKQHRVLRRQPLRQSQRMASCRKGRRIRDRMPGLKDGKAADCTARMSMLRDHDTVRDPRAERLVCSVCHLPRRFSDCDEIDPPGKLRLLQRAAHGRIRLHGRKRLYHDLPGHSA